MSFDSLKENETIFKRTDSTLETLNMEEKDRKLDNYTHLDEKNPDGQMIQDAAEKKYPKFVFLIILNEFCERFSYYGIRTVMFIFLTSK